ncbi:MAG: transporter substrate-binding domain-containing protein [Desulfobacterales bacterium]
MKRQLATVLFLIFLLPITGGWAQELTIISEENPPFNFSRDGVFTGVATEVVREIMQRTGLSARIQVMTWARAYQLALTQPNVVLFSTARTKEREPLFHWVGPIYKVRFGFYALKGSTLKLSCLADAKKVGAIATYKDDVREQLLKTMGFTNLDSSKSPASNLKKLLAGRVDLWLYSNLGVSSVAGQIGIDPGEIELLLPFKDVYAYVAISKGTPLAVIDRWQAALDDMKRDGTFKKISRQWLPAESIPGIRRVAGHSRISPVRIKIFTEDSPPANYLKNGRLKGLAVEIVREILRRVKLPDRIQVVPWARGYTLALTEPNVALFSTTRLPQREKLFKWVGPLYSQTWGFYARTDSPITISSLDQARAVGRIGTYYKDAKEQYLLANGFRNLVSTNRNLSNIRHLMDGSIDLWVSSDFNMPYLARQAGINPERLKLIFPFKRVQNYIAFSNQSPDALVDLWQQTLDELKLDGTYDRLCDK